MSGWLYVDGYLRPLPLANRNTDMGTSCFRVSASVCAVEESQADFDSLECPAVLVETVPAHLCVLRILRGLELSPKKISGLRKKRKVGENKHCGHRKNESKVSKFAQHSPSPLCEENSPKQYFSRFALLFAVRRGLMMSHFLSVSFSWLHLRRVFDEGDFLLQLLLPSMRSDGRKKPVGSRKTVFRLFSNPTTPSPPLTCPVK